MHHSYSSVYFRFFEENIALIVFNKFKNVHHHKFEFKKENNTKQPNKQLKKSELWFENLITLTVPFLCVGVFSELSVNERACAYERAIRKFTLEGLILFRNLLSLL